MTTGTDSKPTTPLKKERRQIWWVLFLFSIVAIAISGVSLAQRIGEYYKEVDHPLFAYIEVLSTDFTFAGHEVHVEEVIDDDSDPAIKVTYGEHTLLLDVVYPPKYQLPTLFDRQHEWFSMLFFADRANMTLDEFETRIANDEIRPRLAIVTRTPFGIEPIKEPRFDSIAQEQNMSSGEVHTDRFRYDFYEFDRDGTFSHEIKRFPESGKSLMRRRVNAELKGQPEPQRAEDEIQEYTWEYGAALKVTNRAPAITIEKQALLNAGWTLPVAASGFLMLVVSFFFAIAPARTQINTGT